MSSFEEVNNAREKLMEALGEKSKEYNHQMKLWFQMKTSKVNFDLEARKLLDPGQIHLHNQFLLQLFIKCSKQDLPAASPPLPHHRTKTKRRGKQHNGGFQQANIHEHVLTRVPPRPQEEPLQYCVTELFLPDSELIHMRMMLAAWELGLKGAEQTAAEVLVEATQQFLKDIITAILSRRNGFSVSTSGVQYAIGMPVPSPWLRTTANYVSCRPDGSVLEVLETGETVPGSCPSVSDLQQDIAMAHAAGVDCPDKKPVSAAECYEALKIAIFRAVRRQMSTTESIGSDACLLTALKMAICNEAETSAIHS